QNLLEGNGWQSDPAVLGLWAPWPTPAFVSLAAGGASLGAGLEIVAVILRAAGFALLAVLLHTIAKQQKLALTAWGLPIILALNPTVFFRELLAQFTYPINAFEWFQLSFPLVGWFVFVLLFVIGYLIDSLITKQTEEGETGFNQAELAVRVGVILLLPLVSLQLYLLIQLNQRPVSYAQAEELTAVWLLENTPPGAILSASPRIGFLANRPVLRTHPADRVEQSPEFLKGVMVRSPHYFVADGSLSWNSLRRTGWLERNYRLAEQIDISNDSRSALTIWEHTGDILSFDRSVTPVLRSEEGLNYVRGSVSTNRIMPSEAVDVRVDWHVDRPPTATLQTIVRLQSPLDQVVWAQRDMRTPRSLPSDWLVADMVFPETFVLTTTEEIPVGGYQVSVSIYQPGAEGLSALVWPNDDAPLDRVTIGYLAVPWQGQVPESAVVIGAEYGNRIKLLSCACPSQARPGALVPISLYWTAAQPIEDNFVAFVHLLDEAGQFIMGIDAPPYGGRYDMRAWLPGDIVPDERALEIPADLPPGEYSLQVGLYHPADGTRLPAVNRDGIETPNQTIVLPSIQIVSE
ncbi:MAG: hypothetical protein AAF902_23230, partial [Chloroflexota bacterium]